MTLHKVIALNSLARESNLNVNINTQASICGDKQCLFILVQVRAGWDRGSWPCPIPQSHVLCTAAPGRDKSSAAWIAVAMGDSMTQPGSGWGRRSG